LSSLPVDKQIEAIDRQIEKNKKAQSEFWERDEEASKEEGLGLLKYIEKKIITEGAKSPEIRKSLLEARAVAKNIEKARSEMIEAGESLDKAHAASKTLVTMRVNRTLRHTILKGGKKLVAAIDLYDVAIHSYEATKAAQEKRVGDAFVAAGKAAKKVVGKAGLGASVALEVGELLTNKALRLGEWMVLQKEEKQLIDAKIRAIGIRGEEAQKIQKELGIVIDRRGVVLPSGAVAQADPVEELTKAAKRAIGEDLKPVELPPFEAVRTKQAQITGTARSGYSSTDLDIKNLTDNALVMDLNTSYLIPSNPDSGSQRLGLVSNAQAKTAACVPLRTRMQVASLSSLSIQQMQTGGFARKNWVLVAPRAHVVIPVHSVCLDGSRGSPGRSEPFYMADKPLPARLEEILTEAALKGEVPQSQVWGTIAAEQIRWYDPRVRMGFPSEQRGLYVGTVGQEAAVYVVSANDPNALTEAAMHERNLQGRTPLHLPTIAPGTYVIWLRPDRPVPFTHSRAGYPLQWSGPESGVLMAKGAANALHATVRVDQAELTLLFRSLLGADAGAQEMEQTYPRGEPFTVDEAELSRTLSARPYRIPPDNIPWIAAMLRRGGCLALRSGLFIHLQPGGSGQFVILTGQQ